jgi:hypothetical protein
MRFIPRQADRYRKDSLMDANLELVTCSLCLRVRNGSEWIEAERVIRDTRSYELVAPPRLRSAVCDVCAESIFGRRMEVADAIAA